MSHDYVDNIVTNLCNVQKNVELNNEKHVVITRHIS